MSTSALFALSLVIGVLGKECKRSKPDFEEDEGGGDDCASGSHPSSESSSTITSLVASSPTSVISNSTPSTNPPPQGPNHFPPSDPTLSDEPAHHPFDTTSLIAVVLGGVVLLLLIIVIWLLIRRRRRRRTNRETIAALEKGVTDQPHVDEKHIESSSSEKRVVPSSSPPASSVGSESRTGSRISRFRRALHDLRGGQSRGSLHSESGSGPAMSEARQGMLITMPSPSQTPSESPATSLADLTQPTTPMMISTSRPTLVGSRWPIVRPASAIVQDSGVFIALEDETGCPPAYDSLMRLQRS